MLHPAFRYILFRRAQALGNGVLPARIQRVHVTAPGFIVYELLHRHPEAMPGFPLGSDPCNTLPMLPDVNSHGDTSSCIELTTRKRESLYHESSGKEGFPFKIPKKMYPWIGCEVAGSEGCQVPLIDTQEMLGLFSAPPEYQVS